MSIVKSILSAIGDVTGISSVGDAAKTVLNAITSNPEIAAKVKELELKEMKLQIEEGEGIRSLWKEEIKSGDAFVRRARPWGLYVGYSLMLIDLGVLSIANALSTALGGPVIPTNTLPTAFYTLFAMMFTGSLAYRAVDKRRNMGDNSNGN